MMSRYHKLMMRMSLLLPEKTRAAFLHPAGPTTVFFWAPTFKWGLVIAGIGDINRPPETISLAQTASLMLTGIIWSRLTNLAPQLTSPLFPANASLNSEIYCRYSLVIIPKNWNLFSVNGFVSLTAAYNFYRGLIHQMANPSPPSDDR
ncbi:mitochondrial pyruvate carrier 2-like isoform X1 [Diachasmimorpha longicaudata]|uniref:mitochondrial pyruvate carrier 2-like isoform X1 n=1 Tax=Diachasmimorpha longicaudata TaxID=58733 RepID=UPI0030B8A8DF